MLIKILKYNYSLLSLTFYLKNFNTIITETKKPPDNVEGL